MCIYDIYDIYIYIYLFQTWKTLKEGLYEPSFCLDITWQNSELYELIYKKLVNWIQGFQEDSLCQPRSIVKQGEVCGVLVLRPNKKLTHWMVQRPLCPNEATFFATTDGALKHHKPFAPLHGTSTLSDVPLPIKVTREGSYKQNLTKYVTIKWSLLLGGVERPHSICCNTWTTTRCCCSSTLPLKPAIVAKRLYTRCFHVFSR